MSKYKITEDGRKALDGRKSLNEKERISHESMKKQVGEDICNKGNGLLWTSAKNKKNNTMVLRDFSTFYDLRPSKKKNWS
ncbi:MAG: hypothetical protein WAL88_00425 [Nitrosotalea sp.]